MIKVFISQPMKGKTEEEILRVREKAIASVKSICNEDVEILDSYFSDFNPDDGCIPLKFLARSIVLLADADIAYFAKGWKDARGCRIEHECAVEYGIKTLDEIEL